MALLECVPNLSEGRRADVLQSVVARAMEIDGVRLLDLSSDPDHNRSVLTLVGESSALVESVLRLYEASLATLSLSQHQGVHPRLGVVDVVPFVPLAGSTMSDAIAAARSLGAQVGERFELPVYLYERAASRPERRNLAHLRRGGPVELERRIHQPTWAPDFGPHKLHPSAGATVIGARFFLIAFNAMLDTRDVEVARQIARRVRQSNGGLPGVRAMGVYLKSRDCAQVSLNLVDYRRTSMFAALVQVRAEAAASGVRVVGTEIVGLVPQEAVLGSLAECLGLPALQPPKLLEQSLCGEVAPARGRPTEATPWVPRP